MVKVRQNVFETNSSSAHALVTGKGGIFKDFAEGRAVWVPYGLEDVPIELAPKCVIAGKQEADIEYSFERSAAVFLRCSDIKDWAAALEDGSVYKELASAVDDYSLTSMLLDIRKRLMDTGDINDENEAHLWLPAKVVGFTILEDDNFQMTHDWNTWD